MTKPMNTVMVEESLFHHLSLLASKQGMDVNQYATMLIARGIRRLNDHDTAKTVDGPNVSDFPTPLKPEGLL